MSTTRRRTAAVLSAAAVTSSLVLTGLMAPHANATSTVGGRAPAWSDFQKADPWLTQSDNLHWYVGTPPITQAQVGKVATIVVDTQGSIDCRSITLGYGSEAADPSQPSTWTTVTPTSTSCTTDRVMVTFTVTQAMADASQGKGAVVTLVGWSRVGRRTTATELGTVTIGGQTWIANSEASRTDVPRPVGDVVPLGMWGNKIVATSSMNEVNEIWVGRNNTWTRYQAPSSSLFSAVLDGNVVHVTVTVPYMTNQVWDLDLATGTWTHTHDWGARNGSLGTAGPGGYWLANGGSPTLQDWKGNTVPTTFSSTPLATGVYPLVLGVSHTGTGFVTETWVRGANGMDESIPTGVAFVALTGGAEKVLDFGTTFDNTRRAAVDDNGLTVLGPKAADGNGQLCTVTLTTAGCQELVGAKDATLLGVYQAGGVTVVKATKGYWIMPTGTVKATWLSDRTAAASPMADAGGKVIVERNGKGAFWAFTADGTMYTISKAV